MTTYCFISKYLIADEGGIDTFINKLFSCGMSMMASAWCWFENVNRFIRVEKINGQNYISAYDQDWQRWPWADRRRHFDNLPRWSCPVSLLGAIVNWDEKKIIWYRDRATHHVRVPKRKARKTTIRAGTYPSPESSQEALY